MTMTANRNLRYFLLAALAATTAAQAPSRDARAQDARQSQSLPAPGQAWVVFGADTVVAEVASEPAQREQGLMNRATVPDGTGMLFVFPESEYRSFWMKDTRVPLDIAFFDDGYRIAGIKQMEPMDESLTDSDAPTALVLEVRRGWFAEQGIGPGDEATVVFGPGLVVR